MSYQEVLWQDILGGQNKSIIFVSASLLQHPVVENNTKYSCKSQLCTLQPYILST